MSKLSQSMLSENEFETQVYDSLVDNQQSGDSREDSKNGKRKTTLSVAEFKHLVKDVEAEEEQEVPFSEKTIIGKVMYIIEFPFMIAAYLTIPPVEQEKLVSPFVILYSLTTPLAFVILKDSKSNLANSLFSNHARTG